MLAELVPRIGRLAAELERCWPDRSGREWAGRVALVHRELDRVEAIAAELAARCLGEAARGRGRPLGTPGGPRLGGTEGTRADDGSGITDRRAASALIGWRSASVVPGTLPSTSTSVRSSSHSVRSRNAVTSALAIRRVLASGLPDSTKSDQCEPSRKPVCVALFRVRSQTGPPADAAIGSACPPAGATVSLPAARCSTGMVSSRAASSADGRVCATAMVTTEATRGCPTGRDQGHPAADPVPGERGAPGVDADLPVAEPHAGADVESGAQVGGEPGVAGQQAAVAGRRGRDDAPGGQVAQQVGVALGGLQPVVGEGDGRQARGPPPGRTPHRGSRPCPGRRAEPGADPAGTAARCRPWRCGAPVAGARCWSCSQRCTVRRSADRPSRMALRPVRGRQVRRRRAGQASVEACEVSGPRGRSGRPRRVCWRAPRRAR